ncbi:hypothetical protein MMC31_007309, partial [Peltigera leucophlebia]|nr:hypothetical protein [Peltigera leucophlebia]
PVIEQRRKERAVGNLSLNFPGDRTSGKQKGSSWSLLKVGFFRTVRSSGSIEQGQPSFVRQAVQSAIVHPKFQRIVLPDSVKIELQQFQKQSISKPWSRQQRSKLALNIIIAAETKAQRRAGRESDLVRRVKPVTGGQIKGL